MSNILIKQNITLKNWHSPEILYNITNICISHKANLRHKSLWEFVFLYFFIIKVIHFNNNGRLSSVAVNLTASATWSIMELVIAPRCLPGIVGWSSYPCCCQNMETKSTKFKNICSFAFSKSLLTFRHLLR